VFLCCKGIGNVTHSVDEEIGNKSCRNGIFRGEEEINRQEWQIFSYGLSY